MKHFQGDTGKSLTEIDENSNVELYETIMYYALKSGYKADGIKEKFSFKIEDMEDVLDECFHEFVEKMPKFFPSANEQQGNKTGNQAKPGKKKSS